MRRTAMNAGWAPPRSRLVYLVFGLLVVTNVFDAWATIDVVRNGAEELNPVMRWALSHGETAFFAIKMTMIVVLGGFLAIQAATKRLAWRGLCFLTVVYLLVFLWHLSIIFVGDYLVIDL